MEVVSDQNWIEKELPCFAAVNRACKSDSSQMNEFKTVDFKHWAHSDTPEFQARLVTLSYQGEGPINQTLLLVGKVS